MYVKPAIEPIIENLFSFMLNNRSTLTTNTTCDKTTIILNATEKGKAKLNIETITGGRGK